MKPILYAGDETRFISNGMGRLADCTRCEVTEERNGVYLCEFDIPVTSTIYPMIQEGRYIGAIHDDRHDIQPFEIYGRTAPIDGLVTFFARHISYKLSNVILKPFTASNCAQALAKMETETYNENPFTFWTDKQVTATFVNDVPASCRSLLAGQEGSILDVYGTGEYEFDKWNVKLYLHRGADNGVSIRYGVNLTDIEHDKDISSSFSAVAPYWKSEEDSTVVTLPEGYVISPDVTTALYPWTTETGEFMTDENGTIIDFAAQNVVIAPLDLSQNFDTRPTVAQLRAAALAYMANNSPWLPKDSITVSFVDMAHTEDYKDVAALQRVSLCDRVNVYCGPLGVNAVQMQVIRTVYNVLTETYNEIELGETRTTYADTVISQVEKKNYINRSVLDEAIQYATDLITGGLGGYVVFNMNADGQPEEILIMDTPDTQTAVNVWRFNKNGLGHSHNGYDGPFSDVALTAEGQINASLITVGKMLADMIQGGTLTLGGQNNVSGVMQVKNAYGNVIGTWDSDGITINGGAITIPIYTGNDNVVQIDRLNAFRIIRSYSDHTKYIAQFGQYGLKFDSTNTSGTNIANAIYSDRQIEITTNRDEYLLFDLTNNAKNTSVTIYAYSSARMYLKNGGTVGTDISDSYIRTNGTKSRVVSTDQYSDRLLYCYETPSPLFGDVGEGIIGDDGRCYIWLDAVFAHTITTSQYQVFLQGYGAGDCWIAERKPGYFVVEGTPGLAFGWELKAKQSDFDQIRLEKAEEPFTPVTHDYGVDAVNYLNDLIKERMAIA